MQAKTFARLMHTVIQEKDMNTQFTNQQKPTLVNVIAWMTLASGIVNLFWGIAASGAVLTHTWGIGIICTPITILPTILGIFEIIYAAKLMSNPPQQIQPSTNIAILEIVCLLVGNLFAVVVGILALVFYNDLVVKDYFARLNGTLAMVEASVPVAPTPTLASPAGSVPEEETASTDETPKG
jgi:hypothetical protein